MRSQPSAKTSEPALRPWQPSVRLVRPFVATLLLAGFLASGGPTGISTGSAAAQVDGGDPGKLVLVMDSSGSMKEPATGGETKIAAAKTALRNVVSDLPPTQPVGLRVYGATVFSRSQAGACTDSQLKVPVAADNRTQLLAAIDSYKPYGETPIGYALQQAGQDLGPTGKRSIVLVSDGEPTCAPDPCAVAKKLAQGGIDLHIDVVGLDVSPQARNALQCIADAGHGTYYDVTNSRDFTQSLQKVATRAARPFTTIGQPVAGTSASTNAPLISNGDWQDRTNGSANRFYRIERTETGSTVHFSAAFRDPDTTVFNTVRLTTPEGDICGASGGVEQLASNALVSSASTAGPIDTFGDYDLEAPCATAPTLIAEVTYSGRTVGVPIEIRVTELPRVVDVASLPKPVDELRWVTPPSGTPRSTQGGSSFNDAPLLIAGSYRDNIVQGETLTYRVHLDWGQQLTAEVGLPALSGQRAVAAEGTPLAEVSVFSPARTPASEGVGTHSPRAFLSQYAQVLGTASGPVAFLNSSASNPGIAGSDVAGLFTVTVFLAKEPGGKSVPVPFLLDLGVSGEPSGAPGFASAPAASPSTATSTGPGSSSPPQSSNTPQSGEEPSSAEAKNDGGLPTGMVLAVLGAVILLVGAGLVLRARRRGAA